MNGYFYVIQLIPDALPGRIKLGFSIDPERRLIDHKTAAPTAVLLGYWQCPRKHERRAIHAITDGCCSHVAGEVYDAIDPDVVRGRATQTFADWRRNGFPVARPKAPVRNHAIRPLVIPDGASFKALLHSCLINMPRLAEVSGVSVHTLRAVASGNRRLGRASSQRIADGMRRYRDHLLTVADLMEVD